MLYTTMNAARMTESTEMLFWTQTHVGVSNHVLNWGAHRYHPVNTTDQSLWQLQCDLIITTLFDSYNNRKFCN